jgi:hypothetical protein
MRVELDIGKALVLEFHRVGFRLECHIHDP